MTKVDRYVEMRRYNSELAAANAEADRLRAELDRAFHKQQEIRDQRIRFMRDNPDVAHAS